MTRIVIKKAVYEQDRIRAEIGAMLDEIDPDRIGAGSRVLIKPNLLMPAPPEKGIVTHPMIVRAAVEYLLEKGAEVLVADSPAVGNFHKLARVTGYNGILDGLDVRLKAFDASVDVDVGEPFGRIPIAKDAIDADCVINLAKLKSHQQMGLTLGVKNTFGCIVGLRKPEWHMRTGVDRHQFARLLVQIHQAVAPAYTIVDGILALEGQGPGKGGQPRELGLLIGGASAHGVDKTICTLLGMAPEDLLTYREAVAMGVFDGKIHVKGDMDIISDFRFPEVGSLSMGPDRFNRFLRKHVIQKPAADNKLCKLCGECWKICPAKAIEHNVRGVQFDYDRCIRCYCCLEVCPHGAIRAKEPLLGRVRRRFIRS